MSVSIAMEELLAWNEESALLWKGWLEANPAALELPCGIGGAATVQDFVRHIWGVELRWAERLQGGPETPKEALPHRPCGGPLRPASPRRSDLPEAARRSR
jgi:hypothetical protein